MKQFRFRLKNEKDVTDLVNQIKDSGLSEAEFLEKSWLHTQFQENLKDEKLKVEIELKRAQTEFLKQRIEEKKKVKQIPENLYGEKGFLKQDGVITPEQLKELEKELDIGKTQEFIATHFGKWIKLRKHLANGWAITCEKCDVCFMQYPSELEADERLKKHLFETHKEEIWRLILHV